MMGTTVTPAEVDDLVTTALDGHAATLALELDRLVEGEGLIAALVDRLDDDQFRVLGELLVATHRRAYERGLAEAVCPATEPYATKPYSPEDS